MQYQSEQTNTQACYVLVCCTHCYTQKRRQSLSIFLTSLVSSPQQTSDSNQASANTRLTLIHDTFFFSVLTFPLLRSIILLPISAIMDLKLSTCMTLLPWQLILRRLPSNVYFSSASFKCIFVFAICLIQ